LRNHAARAITSKKKEIYRMSESEFVNDVSDANFETEVLQSDRPVLVDFWAAWCAPCRMIAPTVAQVAEKYADNARVVKLNVDENPNVPQKYGIKGIPTLILFKNGKEEERVVGATSKEAISRMIDKHVNAGTGAANA
jgi:thioredoxin 1